MKTIDEYMSLPYHMMITKDTQEGGFVASVQELPGCLTVGENLQTVVKNIEDAKRAWLEAALEEGLTIPEPQAEEDYSGQFKLRIPKSLHRHLAEHAKREGISMNQYCLYLLTQYDTMLQSHH